MADGLALNDAGRLKAAGVELVIDRAQQAQIEFIERRHRDNRYSPYLFQLGPAQTAALRARSGVEVQRLVVYETRQGKPEAELTVNAALRIGEGRIEVSSEGLLDEARLRAYEAEVIGWRSNPLADRLARGLAPEAACDSDSSQARPADPH